MVVAPRLRERDQPEYQAASSLARRSAMRLPARRDFGVLSIHLFSTAISSAFWPSLRWTMAACSVYQGAGSRPSRSRSAASMAL